MVGFLCQPAGSRAPLTGRELEVAGLVAEGLTNHSIAARLSIAPRTAEAHVENIRGSLPSRAQIAGWVTERRLRTRHVGSSADGRPGQDRPGLG
jgi:DNA-binding CsgD family transcriptional regulator